jgi:lysylphosphatidylglycerol synthetase-like protein (DUF2156 family)
MQNRTDKEGTKKAISLFLLLHGIGILKTSFDMGNIKGRPNILFGIKVDTYYILGFIIGVILIIDAAGLLMKGKFFYIITMIISLIAIVYIIISIIYIILINGLSADFPAFFILVIFLIIYGAIFINIKSRFRMR